MHLKLQPCQLDRKQCIWNQPDWGAAMAHTLRANCLSLPWKSSCIFYHTNIMILYNIHRCYTIMISYHINISFSILIHFMVIFYKTPPGGVKSSHSCFINWISEIVVAISIVSLKMASVMPKLLWSYHYLVKF